jgi:hypothetical protein
MMTSVQTQASEGDECASVRERFRKAGKQGHTLFVRVQRPRGESPVPMPIARQARSALRRGAGRQGSRACHLAHRATIHAKVLELAPAGNVYMYTDAHPMRLSPGDFGSSNFFLSPVTEGEARG